jgi:hypothetical protein
MTSLSDDARKFWNAALFIRRAPDRDLGLALKVLEQLSRTTTGKVRNRTETLLKDMAHGTDQHPPRTG